MIYCTEPPGVCIQSIINLSVNENRVFLCSHSRNQRSKFSYLLLGQKGTNASLGFNILQRLPITRDLRHSKESDKVAFWWTSIKQKPLKLF